MKDSKFRPKPIADCVEKIPPSGIRDFFDIVSEMEDTISLGVGEPGFPTPWHIRDAAVYALEKSATAYTSNQGLLELRRAIAKYVDRTFGAEYDPKQEILVTTGVSEALDLAIRAIVNPGDEVIYHEPCYVSYAPAIQLAHGIPIAIGTCSENSFRLTADLIRERLTPRTKAVLLNYPNNPTGSVLQLEDLQEIARLAREEDLLVISDEIYAELTYEKAHTSLVSLPGMRDRTIFLHGFSKAWAMTGFRIGYSCAPQYLTAAMTKIHQYTMLCAPTPSQVAAIEALKKFDQDIETSRSRYQANRNFVCNSFAEMALPCSRPKGAFYAFPYIAETGLTSKEFALQLLEEERVAVVPGAAFGPSGEGYIRCSYATSLEAIKPAMSRMADFLARLRKKNRTARISVKS